MMHVGLVIRASRVVPFGVWILRLWVGSDAEGGVGAAVEGGVGGGSLEGRRSWFRGRCTCGCTCLSKWRLERCYELLLAEMGNVP